MLLCARPAKLIYVLTSYYRVHMAHKMRCNYLPRNPVRMVFSKTGFNPGVKLTIHLYSLTPCSSILRHGVSTRHCFFDQGKFKSHRGRREYLKRPKRPISRGAQLLMCIARRRNVIALYSGGEKMQPHLQRPTQLWNLSGKRRFQSCRSVSRSLTDNKEMGSH